MTEREGHTIIIRGKFWISSGDLTVELTNAAVEYEPNQYQIDGTTYGPSAHSRRFNDQSDPDLVEALQAQEREQKGDQT